jgi:hypothetical protein
MLGEELPPKGRDGDIGSRTALVAAFDEASFIGLFPHGQARAGGSPGFDDLGIRTGFGTDPLEQVEDQGVQVRGHLIPPSRQPAQETSPWLFWTL